MFGMLWADEQLQCRFTYTGESKLFVIDITKLGDEANLASDERLGICSTEVELTMR
jgi:hypothetical protein